MRHSESQPGRVKLISGVNGIEREGHDEVLVDVILGDISIVIDGTSKNCDPLLLLLVEFEASLLALPLSPSSSCKMSRWTQCVPMVKREYIQEISNIVNV